MLYSITLSFWDFVSRKTSCCAVRLCVCAMLLNVCICCSSLCSHQSGEVGMASFCRVDSLACRLPSMLSALEEHDFLFQLHLNDMPQDDSSEVRSCCVVCFIVWCTVRSGDVTVCVLLAIS